MNPPDKEFDRWVDALEAHHLAELTFPEVSRALRALSSNYVERRRKLAEGAALSGAGGAFLMLSFTPVWAVDVARGRGWVALAVVIFAAWRPFRLVFGALLFGAMISLGFIAQQQNWGIPSFVLAMLPYLVTLLLILLPSALAPLGVKLRSSTAPAALATPYYREDR